MSTGSGELAASEASAPRRPCSERPLGCRPRVSSRRSRAASDACSRAWASSSAAWAGSSPRLALGELEPVAEGHQLLLHAVVEVAADPAPLLVGGLQDAHAFVGGVGARGGQAAIVPGRMPDQPFANYQYEVYLRGLADQVPELPFFAYDEWQRRARELLDDGPYGYVAGGAGAEDTMRANLEAFRRWRIVPRMLRDVRERDTSVELLGLELEAPLLLAPIGVQRIVHPEAELASARAAASLDVPVVLSTAS